MKKAVLFGLSAVIAASVSSLAMAEGEVKAEAPAKAPKVEKVDAFKKADANGDGKLSLDEFKAMMMVDVEKKFAMKDGDNDGALTAEELKAPPVKRPNPKVTPPAGVPAPVEPAK